MLTLGCEGSVSTPDSISDTAVGDTASPEQDTQVGLQPDGVSKDAGSDGPCSGGCGENSKCINDTCVPWYCPPEGPFGIHPGDKLTDAVVKDCDGNDVHIHELCGAPAAFFNLLAGW